MWKHIKDPFDFTKREQNGLLVLCFLMLVVLVLPQIVRWWQPEEPVNSELFKREAAAFRKSLVDIDHRAQVEYKSYNAAGEKLSRPEYFFFDPNTLRPEGWLKLGLSKKQADVIKNYLSKGGRFRKKQDLQRIYSLSDADYQKLEPYIRIQEPLKVAEIKTESAPRYPLTPAIPLVVELNFADTASLESLRGIGPVLALRILKYRDRLGGFYKKEQLREVYGIDSALYALVAPHVTLKTGSVQKLNINTATFDDLKRHPYLNFKQMNAILQYRKQHGLYTSIDDLAKIAILNEEILRKIAPYLSFDD